MREMRKSKRGYVAPTLKVLEVVAWNEICTYTMSYSDPRGEGGDNTARSGYNNKGDLWFDERYGGARVEIWD